MLHWPMSPVATLAMFVVLIPAAAGAIPAVKSAQCPPGYMVNGGFCTPMFRPSPAAAPKGQCRSGYAQITAIAVKCTGADAWNASFDHLVGGREQLVGHRQAEHPGGLGVDYELELGCLFDRQVSRFGALEDAAGIEPKLTNCRRGQQPAGVLNRRPARAADRVDCGRSGIRSPRSRPQHSLCH